MCIRDSVKGDPIISSIQHNQSDLIVSDSINIVTEAAYTVTSAFIPSQFSSDDVVSRYRTTLVDRRMWDSAYRGTHNKCKTPLRTPVTNVYVSESLGRNCDSYESCVKLITEKLKIENDTRYNFIVAGDGSIYEGLSWN